jgi:hypothetical protein
MSLAGHSLVAHHESKCDLLGPHVSGSQQLFASAEDAALGGGMQVELAHDTDHPDFISTKCHTSQNKGSPSSPKSRSRSLSRRRRRSLPEIILVSNIMLFSLIPLARLPASLDELSPFTVQLK